MEVALIIGCILVLVVLGFFLMNKLDRFLNTVRRSEWDAGQPGETVRIAFENPVMADSVEVAAETFSKKHPGVSFCFYTGNRQEIIWKLDAGAIDIGILRADSMTYSGCSAIQLPCKLRSIKIIDPMGIAIEPLEKSAVYVNVIWHAATLPSVPLAFIQQLKTNSIPGGEVYASISRSL